MSLLDELLAAFVAQKRMKLAGRVPAVLPARCMTQRRTEISLRFA